MQGAGFIRMDMETTNPAEPVLIPHRGDVRLLWTLGQIHAQLRSARQVASVAGCSRTMASIDSRIIALTSETMKVAENLSQSDPESRWASPPIADLQRQLREANALNTHEAVLEFERAYDPAQNELAALLGDIGEPARKRS